MKNLTKRGLSWVLVIALCISLMSGLSLTVFAASYKDTVYTANWGTRGVTASVPSGNAATFYTGEYAFDALMELQGSSTISSVPDSALYLKLDALMDAKHTHKTSYGETRYQYAYTDCQNGKVDDGISGFYTGADLGPEWDSGSTWNREHVWPQSKGGDDSTDPGGDIIALRPASSSANSSRGNKAFGESSGYYDPNSESNGTYNVRGDVARVVLYYYVHWDYTDNMWGSSGVIESVEILLEWMIEDPVDTWEMGRNDVVQEITGNRNIFVDYPELAFQLFDETVPADMPTPSNGLAGGDNAATVTFSENGATYAQASYTGASITLPTNAKAPAEGWSFAGWVTAEQNKSTTKPTVYAAGSSYTVPAGGITLYALYNKFEGSGQAGTFVKTNTLTAGEKVIIVNDSAAYGTNAMSSEIISTYYKGKVAVTPADDKIVTTDASIIWTVVADGDGFNLVNSAGQKLSIDGSYNSIPYDKGNDAWTVAAATATGKVYVVNENGKHLSYSSYGNFSAYGTDSDKYVEELASMELYTCNGTDYYATVTEKAATYDVTFSVPKQVTAVDPMVSDALGIILPAANAPAGYNFVGWVTGTVAETTTIPGTIYAAGSKFVPTADTALKALYSMSTGSTTLVTDASTLQAGDKLILANSESGMVATPFPSGKTFLGNASATFSADKSAITTLPVEAIVFTLAGSTDNWELCNGTDKLGSSAAKALNWGTDTTWKISVDANGVASIENNKTANNKLQYNKSNPRFLTYTSNQAAVQLYRMVGAISYTTEIKGPESTVTFKVPDQVTAVAPMETVDGKITLPVATAPNGYTFVGWVKAAIDGTATAQPSEVLLPGSSFTAEDDITLYALYSKVSSGAAVWKLVTNANQLSANAKVVIAAAEYDKALGITQNTNNRAAVDIVKNANQTLTINNDVQILVLEAGSKTDTWAFGTDSGYLYAASSSKNYLKTQSSINDNASFTIAVTSEGVATIIAQGSNTRNTMQYNTSGLFACYASASQKALSLYVEEITTATVYMTDIPCEHTGGTATCQQQAVCSDCHESYGDLGKHDFSGTTVVKVDGEYHATKCANCDALDTDNKVKHTGGSATCTTDGKCTACDAAYLKATGHADATFVQEEAATCKDPGVKAHYHCAVCNADYLEKKADAVAQSPEDLKLDVDPKAHPADKITPNAGSAAGCHEGNGTKPHSSCAECGALFLADGTIVEAGDLVATPANKIVFVKEDPATTTKEGLEEHWYCAGCGKYYADAEGKTEVTRDSLVIAKLPASANTGDHTALGLMLVLVIMAGSGMAAIVIFRKKRLF